MNSLTKQGTHYKYNGTEFNKDLSCNDKLESISIVCNVITCIKFPFSTLNLKELILIGLLNMGPFPNLSSLTHLETLKIINTSGRPPQFNISGCVNLIYFKCLGYKSDDICYITGMSASSDTIDVSKCLKLEYYHTRCNNTDLSKCINLKYVDCIWNANFKHCLTSCHSLDTLILNRCSVSTIQDSLNLSKCVNLKYIEVNNGKSDIYCNHSSINMPNISKCTKLTHIKCYGNALLPDLTECINLNHFEYKGCYPLPDLSKCSKLEYFDYKGEYSLPNLSHCKNIKIIYNGIQQEHHRQIRFEEETKHKFEQLELFHIEESFHKNDILSKIEERFNKLEEENKRLRKMIDEMRPARSKFM
jgi:hypothetical protein